MILILLHGAAIGAAIAAPIGPVGLMCIRKAFADGRRAAFAAGMGAALADALFGAVVGLGLGAVSDFVGLHRVGFTLGGAGFLLVLGVKTWRSAATEVAPVAERGPGMARDFAAAFLITVTNPATILGVLGVFAALGAAARPDGALESALLVLGVFLGSTAWWLVLSNLASAARGRIAAERVRLFNHVSGALLLLFAAGALVNLGMQRFS